MIDLIDAQRAHGALGLEHERAVALARRRPGRLVEQRRDVEHRQDRAVQVADAAERRRCGRDRRSRSPSVTTSRTQRSSTA